MLDGMAMTVENESETEETRWQAVLARDPGASERFIYAVTSTGIYCRPTCPSRRPRRENVAFFATAEEARRAGFRPCQRCRPDAASAADPARERVLAACRFIESRAEELPKLDEIARYVGVSAAYLQRTFTRILGVSPRAYGDALRWRRFKREVREGGEIAGALYGAGYGSSSRLYEAAPRQLGMTPKAYRDHGRGERIRVAAAPCALGVVVIGATDRGVCAVRFGASAKALDAELRAEFSAARIAGADAELAGWLKAITAYLDGASTRLDLPLDVRGTAFERRVWEAIQRVDYGATATYGEIAKQVRRPEAVRAVANACARNPVALLVPCHRVVPKGGRASGGYRWGVRRKQRLLHLERVAAAKGKRS